MEKTTTVVAFRQDDSVDDPLTELARDGARRMLAEGFVTRGRLRGWVVRRSPPGWLLRSTPGTVFRATSFNGPFGCICASR